MRAMSISRFGRASRMAMSGTRVCPPAMIRASSPAASIALAWSRSAGLAYSNGAGFIERRALAFGKRAARTAIGPRPLPLSWGRTRVTGERWARFSVRRALRLAETYSLLGLGGRSAHQHCPATTHKKARKDLHDGRSGRLSWLRIGFEPSAVGTRAGRRGEVKSSDVVRSDR